MTRRKLPLVLAMALTFSIGLTGAIVPTGVAQAETQAKSSMTKSGKGEFADLKVTVEQTTNLVDQVIRINWTGGKKTKFDGSKYAANYLQIMQCWGESSDGPDRTQCQFGGFTGESRGGSYTEDRQVTSQSLIDPKETITTPPGKPGAYVPFRSVDPDDELEDSGTSEYFDSQSTNEIPWAQTRADGSGEEFFTVQTGRDAAGLGCGIPVTKGGKPRNCWLVVVPRGETEVDGSQVEDSGSRIITSSPLSQSNWDRRIYFPLGFEAVGDTCPIGGAERKIVGHEAASEAVHRWQPTLCAGGETVYNYSQLTDDAARRELLSSDPGLVVTNRALTAVENTDQRPITYAPIGISSLTVAYNIDTIAKGNAPADVKARNGERIGDLRLTPRLIAKLLTQSYKSTAHPASPSVAGNPFDLASDKEFLALNPRFAHLVERVSASVLVPVYRADMIELLWTWLMNDPEAKAFLEGKADENGMKINKDFAGMELPRADYPKSDSYCSPADEYTGAPSRCTIDQHPYTEDQYGAARAASRGDMLTRSFWDNTAEPPSWKRDAAQFTGERLMIAFVDTASADRYGLETAAIRNAAGEFVEPTVAGMHAAVAAMQPSGVPSVLAPAPAAKAAAAYPLTAVSYAATPPQQLSQAERKDYAALLRYAAGPGQTLGLAPGTLPYGYAPLTSKLRAQATAAAALLLKGQGSKGSTGTDEGDVPPDPTTVAANNPLGDGTGTGVVAPTVVDPGAGGTTDLGGAVLASATTPDDLAGLLRYAPLIALLAGLVAVVAGPAVLLWNRYELSVPAVRKRLRVFAR